MVLDAGVGTCRCRVQIARGSVGIRAGTDQIHLERVRLRIFVGAIRRIYHLRD